jgi:hypothetical protein
MGFCEITKEDNITRVSVGFKTHTITDKKVLIHSISKIYGVSIENIKECNPKIPRKANGDLIVDIDDEINIPILERKGSTTTPNNGQYPKSKSSSCAPWMDVALKEATSFYGQSTKAKTEKEKINSEKLSIKVKEQYHVVGKCDKCGTNISWCASFVSWCLNEFETHKGIPESKRIPKSASSQAFMNPSYFKKIEKPAYGAIAVFRNFNYMGNDADKDFIVRDDKINSKTVFLKDGRIEYIQDNKGYTVSIKKNDEIIFDSRDSDNNIFGHVNFVLKSPKRKEYSHVLCLGGNQNGGHISQNQYDYRKDKLYSIH